jgi:hypothetical protein
VCLRGKDPVNYDQEELNYRMAAKDAIAAANSLAKNDLISDELLAKIKNEAVRNFGVQRDKLNALREADVHVCPTCGQVRKPLK